MLSDAYSDMIHLTRPVSKRHPMAVEHRAKQFAPFAALRGFEDTVREKEIVYESGKDLPEEKQCELDMKLRTIECGMEMQATFFVRNPKMPGKGQYHTVKGRVEFFDPPDNLRIDDTEIPIPDIVDLCNL